MPSKIILLIISLAASTIIIIPWPGLILRLIAVLLFLLVQSKIIGHSLFKNKELYFQFILGLITVLSFIMIAGSVAFYTYQLNNWSLSIITILLPVIVFLPLKHAPPAEHQSSVVADERPRKWRHLPITILAGCFYLMSAAAIIYLLITSATTAPLQSPWLTIPAIIFILYFISTLLLIIYNLTSKYYKPLVNSVHFFLSLGVVIFIYPLGFGFDPFIHQTTENIILNTGTISPKPFYYIGQYSLIVWLAHWLPISVKTLDIWLLPILSSLFIPPVIYYAFKYNFKTENQALKLLPLTFLLLPYGSLIQTTPQGLSFLWSLLIIFLSLFYINRQGVYLVYILFLSMAGLVMHPLSGIPLLFFTLLLGLYHRFWQTSGLKKYTRLTLYWLFSAVAAIIMPLVFMINSYISQGTPIAVEKSGDSQEFWAALTFYYHQYLRPEDLIYFFGLNIKLLMIIAALAGLTFVIVKKRTHYFLHYIVTFLALLTNYWLLITFVNFNFLVVSERFIFPDRILNLSLYFLLPFIFLISYWVLKKIIVRPAIIQLAAFLLAGLFITTNWYLTYPRFDFQVQDKGYNVSSFDKQAIRWINTNGLNSDYVVLANQSVSAAALEEYGFAKYYQGLFYYPIPTGDQLYQSYLDVVRNRKTMTAVLSDVKALTGVTKVYVVLNDYWFGFEDIVTRLKTETDQIQIIEPNRIHIFSFKGE